jgi:outer membrane protein OmpA-like peptidoglycan-associated protein
MKTLNSWVWVGLFACSLLASSARAGQVEVPPASPAPSLPESIVPSDEVEKLRVTVLKRMESVLIAGKTDKGNLRDMLVNSKDLTLLFTVPFETALTKITLQTLAKITGQIEQPKIQERLSDPNVVVLVIGFADQPGPDDRNFDLSRGRAESVAAVLRERYSIRNIMHVIPMGSRVSFDSQDYAKKRVVEVWCVRH